MREVWILRGVRHAPCIDEGSLFALASSMIASTVQYRSLARKASLKHVSDESPGIVRRRQGRGFVYLSPSGRRLRDAATLRWIAKLAIPPAWEEVWICSERSGHLQATGRDDRGRKQYRYHPRWHEAAGSAKYASLVEFCHVLPRVRRRIAKDIESSSPRTRALAAIVRLIDLGKLRVGGEAYARENHSHGAVTLERRHVEIVGDRIHLKFKAKSAVVQEIELEDACLAHALKRLARSRTRRIFSYIDEAGRPRKLSSNDVNGYLQDISGAAITAKDFRTWHGSVVAATTLSRAACDAPRKRDVDTAIRAAAKELGNTLATCRKHYVHPGIVETFLAGGFARCLAGPLPSRPLLRKEERLLVLLLNQ